MPGGEGGNGTGGDSGPPETQDGGPTFMSGRRLLLDQTSCNGRRRQAWCTLRCRSRIRQARRSWEPHSSKAPGSTPGPALACKRPPGRTG